MTSTALSLWTFLIFLFFMLTGIFLFLCKRVRRSDGAAGVFSFVILGMLIGALFGFIVFFHLDSTKGWNPFGWWFPASFLAMVLCGMAGLMIYGILSKKK